MSLTVFLRGELSIRDGRAVKADEGLVGSQLFNVRKLHGSSLSAAAGCASLLNAMIICALTLGALKRRIRKVALL